ncbi:hypothetical protein AJ79_05902 [Helicocarpus griseus UAMH5409]|uniref:Uncharacterized protein n=1 Tax=Helicocarpus griseus UAMH5409 TaxID=1447875 RepID=A0A2B7XIV1_9EURO|nr:hypothetical protein AJ79_05902 [Helicocarpus griseus UAMH5409]
MVEIEIVITPNVDVGAIRPHAREAAQHTAPSRDHHVHVHFGMVSHSKHSLPDRPDAVSTIEASVPTQHAVT